MKKVIKLFVITAIAFIFAISTLSAQTPSPPNNNGGDPTTSGNTPVGGGGAPIGGGLFILLGLGAVYGAKKLLVKKGKE